MPSASKKNKEQSIIRNLDWFTLFIFVVLVAMGWMSVCGASYDFDQGTQLLDFSSRSGMQMVWILTSLVLGSVILCVDDRLVESLSYIIYIGFIVLLFVTPMLAHDIKGSLSWIKIGSFSLQPAEFAKFATALCVAKVISSFNFDLSRWRDLIISTILVLLPMGLIVMQKETGSALVYLAFFLMFNGQKTAVDQRLSKLVTEVRCSIGSLYEDVSRILIQPLTFFETLFPLTTLFCTWI